MKNAIATNKQALRDYSIFETIEAGIELRGSEVKALRDRKVNFVDSFARIEEGQILLFNMHISPYAQASYLNAPEKRPRKLLLHKKEIDRLFNRLNQSGFTLVPLNIYFNERGFAKVTIALCKGKKLYDRREDIKKRAIDMQIKRMIKNRG